MKYQFKKNTVHLIESKHTKDSLIPSKGDIKDGLLKMILYCNLEKVMIGNLEYKPKAVLNLTSTKIVGKLKSGDSQNKIEKFLSLNKIISSKQKFILDLFNEAETNNFKIIIQSVKR